MATPQQINDIAGLYVAYFDRAPDPAGLQFWIDQLDGGRDFATISQDFAESEEAKEIYPFLATPDLVTNSPAAFVTSIYANLFGRAPDAAGLNFWVDVLGNGEVAPGDMVEAIMLGAQDTLVNGELIQDKTTVENKIECALAFTTEGASTEGFEFNAEAYSAARQSIEGVDATDASVETAKAATFQYFAEFVNETTFTLCDIKVLVSPEEVSETFLTETVLYWGYNPHSHDETDGVDNLDGNNPDGNDNNLTNEGPEDGGIPASVFFETYLAQIIGATVGAIFPFAATADDQFVDFPDLTGLTDLRIGDGNVITFEFGDGTTDDVLIAQEYADIVRDIIFDEEGNSRFFEKTVATQVAVVWVPDTSTGASLGDGEYVVDPLADEQSTGFVGFVDAVITETTDAVYATVPIVLTPTENNGGTKENGFTTASDDLIQVGRLDLLHGAILDGGLGVNTLEIDAKGHFAQPKSLENIQHVAIENLPNVYTIQNDDGNQYPDVVDGNDSVPAGDNDSIIDLSRAIDIETLTITQGDYEDLNAIYTDAGDLTVTGIRNGIVTTLDGHFSDDGDGGDIRLNYSGNTGDGIFIRLNNANIESDLEVSHNGQKLTIESAGGGNFIDNGDLGGGDSNMRELVITGEAHLFIEGDLDPTFERETPITIDASANSGGVDLNLSDQEKVTFVGSKADDRFAVATTDSNDTGTGGDFDNDQSVTITNTIGNNYYDINTNKLTLVDGDGDNNVEADIWVGDITLGDGNNHVEGYVSNLVAVAGDGDNKFDIEAYDADQLGPWFTEDDYPTLVDLTAGEGSNIFNVFASGDDFWGGNFLAAATINITAGDGGNLIQIPALPREITGYQGVMPVGLLNTLLGGENGTLSNVTVNTGSGDDTMVIGGSDITVNSGGGNDVITLLGIDDDYVTEAASAASVNADIAAETSVIEITPELSDDPADNDVDAFIAYSVNGVISVVEATLGAFDLTDADEVAGRIADVLDGIASVDATAIGNGKLTVTGDGASVEVLQVTFDGNPDEMSAAVETGTFSGLYGSAGTYDAGYNYKGFIPSVFGATLDIDTGAGSATIKLGAYQDDAGLVSGAIVAKEGSTITGQDISLFVNTHADLRAADLSGITSVVMDDDAYAYGGQGFPSGLPSAAGSASLTLLDTQVTALLADGVAFSTQGETFGAQSLLTIIITSDTTLSDLLDLASWNDSIKLCFVVEDGVTLTLTAEELHTYVAPDGIAVDEQNGYNDNQVVVTDAGFGFDPFNDQNGGTGAGTVAGSLSNEDVSIIYTPDGYERPSQDGSTATISVNSDDTPVVDNIVSPFAKDLVIEGDADLEITGKVDLADDFTIDFSDFNGDFPENADGVEVAMTIYNFQEITGDVNTLLASPNNGEVEGFIDPYSWGRIDGNGTSDDPVRINVVMQPDTSAGDCDWGVAKGGIFSSGVQQYVLTGFVDANDYDIPQASGEYAEIVVCDHTEDLEVLGLQNNRNGGVTFHQVNWGTTILMEGDGYANASDQEKNLGDPDLSEVGFVTANFFEAGANAFVRVTNQGTELGLNEDAEDGYDPDGERKLIVAGVVVNNADRLRIDVEDGDAIIKDVTGIDVERVIVNGPEDVELRIDCVNDDERSLDDKGNAGPDGGLDSDDLKSIDGTGVAGEFKLTFDGEASGDALTTPVSGGGTPTPTLDAWGNPVYDQKVVDLSGVVLTGVDAIDLAGDNIKLIMTADQLLEFGSIITTSGDNSTLDVVGLSDQVLDLSAIDVDTIGTIILDDAAGAFTIDPATDFSGAQAVVLNAVDSDTTVEMTLDQFQSISGTASAVIDGDTVTVSSPNICFDEAGGNDAKLVLTGVEGDDQVDLTNVLPVDTGEVLDVEIRGSDFVGTADFAILPASGTADGMEVFVNVILDGGVNDVTDVPITQLYGIDCLTLEGGAELTITAEALALLMSFDPQQIKVADGETATINVTDLSGELLDLDQLVADNPGLTIGTVTIADTDTAITINAGTTFGGANVVTPTADISDNDPSAVDSDPTDGVEVTTTTMSVAQYLTTSGSIVGDGLVNLTNLIHNNDGDDADILPDTALVDTSGITAPHGTITLGQLTVKLNEATDISGFAIQLSNGQMIQFATEGQAAATVNEISGITAVAWCFDEVTGPVDTSGYDSDINTLYITEDLVDFIGNEPDLWTQLAGSIKVEKVNDGLPDVLVAIDRVNIFQAFTSNDGVTYDDQNEFFTIANLTLNLEGNTAIGDIGIGDTVVPSGPNTAHTAFDTLYINSYLDEDSTTFPFSGDQVLDGTVFLPNQLGNIGLNAGSTDELLNVEIRTFEQVGALGSDAPNDQSVDMGTEVDADGFTVTAGGGFFDMANVGDTDGHERDGLELTTGTITFGGEDAGDFASLLIEGGNDVTIAGLDISDAEVVRLDVNIDNFLDGAVGEPELTIAGQNIADLDVEMNLSVFSTGDALDGITYIDTYTAAATDSLGFDPAGPETVSDQLLVVTNGANDLKLMTTPFDVKGVYFTGDSTLDLTGAQVNAIGIIDGAGTGASVGTADGAADNWKIDPGVSATVNICIVDPTIAIDLDAIAATGINIGTITIAAPGGELHADTTLGGADKIVIELTTADVPFELTAAQFQGFSGIIEEDRSGLALTDPTIEAHVTVDELEGIESGATSDTSGTATIDLSNVSTTGTNSLYISSSATEAPVADADGNPGDGDVALTDAADLGNFQVVLWDIDSDGAVPDELAGHTIRFATVVQADGRVVTVMGPDLGVGPEGTDEKDTNIVFLFEEATSLDAAGYSSDVGRIWVREDLVDFLGGDFDSLFTVDNSADGGLAVDFTLHEDIIKRIEATDLTEKLLASVPLAQRVEITSYTDVAGLEFEIDELLLHLSSLRIDMGGVTDIGNLEVDNLIGPATGNPNFPGDDDFGLLTINSFLANDPAHYLLPDEWTTSNPLPSDDAQIIDQSNNIGDITSGEDRDVLRDILINTGLADPTVTPVGGVDEVIAGEGADLNVREVIFEDDGLNGIFPGDTEATLTITGENDVTFKSLDISDAEISTLTINTAGHTGVVTVTGGSPALDGGDAAGNSETLTISNGSTGTGTSADGVVNFGVTWFGDDPSTDPAVEDNYFEYNENGSSVPYAGISGETLSDIDTSDHGGIVNLGVIAQIDSEDFTLTNTGTGLVTGCVGTGDVNGTEIKPELSATGEWIVTGPGVELEIKDVTLNAGGKLTLIGVEICITGDIDLSQLAVADLTIGAGTTFEVKAGGKLTLTVEQVDALGGLEIFGEGTVCVVGESGLGGLVDTDFANLRTATVDLSAVTLEAADTVLEITANGAEDSTGADLVVDGDRVAQTIIGSANDDALTIGADASDGVPTTIDVIARLGADGGDIGVPEETTTTNTPVDLTPEVAGDTISFGGLANAQIEVDAGFDTALAIATGDVVQVAAGAEFFGYTAENFVATADTTNDGIAVIEADGATNDVTLDVSAAGGANGWTLIGAADASGAFDMNTLIGSDQDDTIIDGSAEVTGVPATEGNNDGEEDTHTGNGGADTFVFDVAQSDVADVDVTVVDEGRDEEEITSTSGGFAGGTVLRFEFTINGTSPAVIDITDGVDGADLTTDTGIADALAAAINDRADSTATVTGGTTVVAAGLGGVQFDLDTARNITGGIPGVALAIPGSFTVDEQNDIGTYGDDTADDDDDRTEVLIEMSGTVSVGEVYTISIERSDGGSYEATHTVTVADVGMADPVQAVLDILVADLNGNAGGFQSFATSTAGAAIPAGGDAVQSPALVAGQLLAWDNDQTNGGFTVTQAGGTASVVSLSSSSILDGSETTLAETDADVITDFVSVDDSIDFALLPAGTDAAGTYTEAAEVADFTTALGAANTAMGGGATYHLTSTAADGGLLFYDANGDGSADGVVSLTGIDASNFAADDIV